MSSEPSSQGNKTTSYIPALDGIRAIAFLLVFLAHNTGNTISKLIPATFGVTIFFFLSGYLITTLLRKEWDKTENVSLRDFYIRRSLRIVPPLAAAYALATFFGRVLHAGDPGNLRALISTIFYVYNYTGLLLPNISMPSRLDVTWSLSVEEHFYLIFPFIFLWLMRRRISRQGWIRGILVCCTLALAWRTWAYYHMPVYWTYKATDCRFDSILWGVLLALWNNPKMDEPIPFLRRYAGPLAGASILLLVASMAAGGSVFRETGRYTLQGILLYLIFYFAISHIDHPSVHWLESKPLRYTGWLSYSLYLIHLPMMELLLRYYPGANDMVKILAGGLLAFVYAVIVRYTIELPLQNWRSRFRHGPRPVAPGAVVEGI